MSSPWEDFGPWTDFEEKAEVPVAVSPELDVPSDIGASFIFQPESAWLRNQTIETPVLDDRTPGERAEAALAQGGIGLQQGFYGLGEAGWSLVQAANEPIAEFGPISITPTGIQPTVRAKERAETARELALESQKSAQELEPLGEEVGGPRIMRTIGAAIPSIAPALATGPAGIIGPILAAGAQQFGSTVSQAQSLFEQMPEERRHTFFTNPEFWDAFSPAALDAIQTSAITAVAGKLFGSGIEGATVPAKRAAIDKTIGQKTREIVGEALEESAQQFVSDYAIGKMSYKPEMTLDEAVSEAIQAGIAGGVVGAGVVGGTSLTTPRERIPDVIQSETAPVLRDVREPEIPQEGQVQVPVSEGRPQAAEALTEPTLESDKALYQDITSRMTQLIRSGQATSPLMEVLKGELEVVKNRHGGMPPGQTSPARQTMQAQQAAMRVELANEIHPAVRIGGRVISDPNKGHIQMALEVGGPEAISEVSNPANQGFVYKGEFISREATSGLLGEKTPMTSERLKEIRAEKPKGGEPSEEEKRKEEVLEPGAQAKAEIAELAGMGGATPSEFAPPKPFTTSNKNAVVDEERNQRGLPPMMGVARQSNQAAWDEAMRQVDENPQVQDELITALAANPRAVTATENAMLLHRRIDLRNEYEKALLRWRQAFEGDDMVRASEESQRVRDWSSKLSDLEDITKATGAESGRSLQARKMMANEDYSLAAMELRAMEAKGRNLTPQEHIELIKAQERITQLENRLLELEGQKEAKEVDTATSETMKEISSEAPNEPKSKDFDVNREETLLSGIKSKVEKGQTNDISSLVQQLARLFWRRGIRSREPMIDALHETIKTIIPDFTRDQTQRAFSGYGNFKPLSKEDIDVGLRDLRGQTQQVLKLEALEARKPLEKTGQERRVPSDEERRLIKQVNELKRKYGVVVTDPATQLKSALAARKTYYEHRIADLRHEIETRQRIIKTKTAPPTDPELDALIEEHERIKAEHEQIFVKPGMTDEQRLKLAIAAAERNQAHWEVRLQLAEIGIFDKRTPGRKVTSPELELIQAETAAIREHVKELHDLDAAVLEAKRTESLERQKSTLEKQIAEQERKLREGDLTTPGKPMTRPADPVLEELLQKRDALNKQLAEARKKPESQRYAESQQRELDRLNKSIAEREDKIARGDISTEPKKVTRPMSTPELEQARQKLDAVNKQLAEMRKAARPVKTKEEIALQSLKTRMKNRIADFRRRIVAKDFAKKVRQPIKLDPEGLRIKSELDLAKQEFETKAEQDRWARMSVFQKTKRKIADVYDAARALMTTGEFSFILRQGKIAALSHPIKTAKALPDMFRALLANEKRAHEIDLQTHNDPEADAARAAKLHLVEEGVSLHKQEEILMGRWVGKIPIVKNFNRAAQVFLNRIRLDMWKAMRKSMSKSGTPTPDEDRQIAMFVNEATGRGGLGKLEPAAVPLARVMFSPRYYASRLQLAAGHSLWGGTMRTRRIIATEYARSLVGLGLYYTALALLFAGDDDEPKKGSIESDPRSSDFGKVRIGKTRLDPLAGLSQIVVLGARTATGEKKTLKGEVQPIRGKKVPFGGDKWSDIVARHLRGKLHPVPSAIANLFDGTDLGGEEATVVNQTKNIVAPITYLDIYAALKEQDLDDGVALALLGLLGEGIQTYEEKK